MGERERIPLFSHALPLSRQRISVQKAIDTLKEQAYNGSSLL
jgi:hypothetical protein